MELPLLEDVVTASHRPFIGLSGILAEQQITAAAVGNLDECSIPPTKATVDQVIDLVVGLPTRLIGEFDVSLFYGEVHISWVHGAKQVVLMSFPNRIPLIHHYARIPGSPSEHGIEDASVQSLANWLAWLRL
jgi:hypothetical protein